MRPWPGVSVVWVGLWGVGGDHAVAPVMWRTCSMGWMWQVSVVLSMRLIMGLKTRPVITVCGGLKQKTPRLLCTLMVAVGLPWRQWRGCRLLMCDLYTGGDQRGCACRLWCLGSRRFRTGQKVDANQTYLIRILSSVRAFLMKEHYSLSSFPLKNRREPVVGISS